MEDINKFISQSLEKLGVMYMNKAESKSWTSEKNIDTLSETEAQEFNLRTQMKHECVLDIEDKAQWIAIEKELEARMWSYKLYDTGSRGYHAHLIFSNLARMSPEERSYIRGMVIKDFNTDKKMKGNLQFLAVEDKPHFKTGNVKSLVKEFGNQPIKLADEILMYARTNASKVSDNVQDNSPIKVKYKDVLNDRILKYILSNEITNGDRNNTLFKNLAILLAYSDLGKEVIDDTINKIIVSCPGKTKPEFMGWYQKAVKGELTDYNEDEMNTWINNSRHKDNIINYPVIGELGMETDAIEEKPIAIEQEEKKEIMEQNIDKKIIVDKNYEDTWKSNFSQYFSPSMDFLQMAKEFHTMQPFFYAKEKLWWFWNDKVNKYELVDETDVMNSIDDRANWSATTDSKIKGRILESMKRVGRKNKPEEASKYWIQFKDVVVDIQTGERFKASPRYFMTNPIPWKVGTETDTPTIDRLFTEWVGEKYKEDLYELIAYCTLTYMPIHRIFALIGEGLNGKSTYLRLVEKFVGKQNTTATNIDRLSNSTFEVSKLFKKLVAIIGEVDRNIFRKTSLLKSLSGDDLLSIEYKGKDAFDSHNYAKPLIATNKLPETTDRTAGFFRRWTIIDFPNRFHERRDVLAEVSDKEFENLCAKIPSILQRLLGRGEFAHDGSIEDREKRYNERASPVRDFIAEYCDIEDGLECSNTELYYAYTQYLEENGYPKESSSKFGRTLSTLGYEKYNKNIKNDFGNASTSIFRRNLALKSD